MGLRVNSNIASLNAQRSLSQTTDRLQANYRRLSTGLRISTASDDAAGLAISERFRAQIRSTGQAIRNAQDGISLTQTGEGALNEVSSILIRMRELSIQASNGTVSQADRTTLDQEFEDLINEIDRIAQSTTFNGVRLLDGTGSTIRFTKCDKRTMPYSWAAALVLSVWPGVVLTDALIPSSWGWIGTHVYEWYLPLTIISNIWTWIWAVRKTDATTRASAIEAIAAVATEVSGRVES